MNQQGARRTGAPDPGAELAAYGAELEAAGMAQVGAAFTSDIAASQLIETSPNAFLFGVLFTQGIPAERAWVGPALLLERLGTLDPGFLATNPNEVRSAIQAPPMLHRFKETLPRWVVAAARRLVDEYGGDASRIWPDGSHVTEVAERLSAFEGIGQKKSAMAVEILQRHFGVRLAGRECGEVAYDVHVRRVFLRSGLATEDTPAAMQAAAKRVCASAPGRLDLAAWLIGRDWCRPRAPKCEECRLGPSCPRLMHLTPQGVGARGKE